MFIDSFPLIIQATLCVHNTMLYIILLFVFLCLAGQLYFCDSLVNNSYYLDIYMHMQFILPWGTIFSTLTLNCLQFICMHYFCASLHLQISYIYIYIYSLETFLSGSSNSNSCPFHGPAKFLLEGKHLF